MIEIMPESERMLVSWAREQDYAVGERVYREALANELVFELTVTAGRGNRSEMLEEIIEGISPTFRRKIIFPIEAAEYSLYAKREDLIVRTPEELAEIINSGQYSFGLDVYLGNRLNAWNSGRVTEAQINEHSIQAFGIVTNPNNESPILLSDKGDAPVIALSGDARAVLSRVINYIAARIKVEGGCRRR